LIFTVDVDRFMINSKIDPGSDLYIGWSGKKTGRSNTTQAA